MDNENQERLDRVIAVLVDLQRRVENLERVACGGKRRVEQRAKQILVDPRRESDDQK